MSLAVLGPALALAGCITAAPEAPRPTSAQTLEGSRAALARSFQTTQRIPQWTANLGALLAWRVADLPRTRARWPEPIGTLGAGAAFQGGSLTCAAEPGGAIGALIRRWDTLYPSDALNLERDVTPTQSF
ncbi:MAG TPA: hypothetical protein VJY35_16575 [Candidatus Eisenbacteria bacterium]|nr:hypothetical protein [Candidatus Eisenbacteria bacterium]